MWGEQKNLTFGLATLALSIATASTAQAALINGVTATTDMGELSRSNISNIVSGSGLPGDTPSLTGTHRQGFFSNAWIGSLDTGKQFQVLSKYGNGNLAGLSEDAI